MAETYRWKGHSKSDAKVYRTKEEEEEWKEKDPIANFEQILIKQDLLGEDKIKEIKDEVDAEVKEAVEFAKESPYPDKEEIFDDVYVDREVEL